jgi:hypothetical protein
MFFGIISYTYFLNCLIVSSRIYLALAAFTSAIVHYIFKFIYLPEISVQTALGTVSLTIFAAIITITLLLMVKNLLRSLPIIHYLRSLMGRFIKVDYSRLKQFHNITALASAIVAVHVLLSTSTQENFTRMSLMGAWALVALILFVYHKLIRL